MAIRIIDIARDVKVPPSTVGNILRNDSRYGGELKNKVLLSAQKLGYRPNILARGLKGGKTKTVGIVWPLKGFHTPAALVQGIAQYVQEHGFVAHISDSYSDDPDVIEHILIDYIQRGVDAVVIRLSEWTHISRFRKHFRHFRAVLAVSSISSEEPVDQVIAYRDDAINEVVDHFISTGRQRPMIMVPPTPRGDKIEPFLNRLKYHGIEADDTSVILHPGQKMKELPDICWNIFENQFRWKIPFDAIFCGVDEVAVVAYRWLMRREKRIPEDVAVVGFNDSMFSRYLTPPLASINRRDEEVARAIQNMLFRRMENPELAPQKVVIPMQFMKRQSAGTM